MNYEKNIEIPFGAKDSELKGWECTIPEGFTAEIKDGKVIVREKASEDERIRRQLINVCNDYLNGDYSAKPCLNDIKWLKNLLEKQKEQKPAECGEDERIRKWMINQLSAVINTESAKEFDPTGYEMAIKALSWLEKQKINTEGDFGRGYDCGYEACLNSHGAEWFEKQKEKSEKLIIPEKENEAMKAIESIIRVHGKTQGEWIAGYDMDTLVVHLRKAFAALEKQKEIPMSDSTKMIKMWDEEKKILERMYLRGDTWRLIAYNAFIDGLAKGTCVKSEKQEEQKPAEYGDDVAEEAEEYTGKVDCGEYGVAVTEAYIAGVLSERNRKPAEWSEEDETCLTNILIMLQEYVIHHYSKDDVNKSVDWLKSLPERFNLQPKQEWSEEDITNGWTGVNLERYLSCLQKLGTGNPQQPETINSKWFKEHCRPQPREEIYQSAKHDLAIRFMNYLDENRPEGKMGLSNGECEDIDKAFKEYDWAKIMRYVEKYRSSWKPSEEQMEALKWLVEYMSPSEKYIVIVKNLYEQLKKLM